MSSGRFLFKGCWSEPIIQMITSPGAEIYGFQSSINVLETEISRHPQWSCHCSTSWATTQRYYNMIFSRYYEIFSRYYDRQTHHVKLWTEWTPIAHTVQYFMGFMERNLSLCICWLRSQTTACPALLGFGFNSGLNILGKQAASWETSWVFSELIQYWTCSLHTSLYTYMQHSNMRFTL